MGLMTLFQGPSFKYLLITKLIDLIIFEKLYYTFWQKNLFRDMWISCFMRLSFAYMAISETCRHDFYTFYWYRYQGTTNVMISTTTLATNKGDVSKIFSIAFRGPSLYLTALKPVTQLIHQSMEAAAAAEGILSSAEPLLSDLSPKSDRSAMSSASASEPSSL